MNRLILLSLFSVLFSNLTFSQIPNALENSGTGYTSGIGGINVVGTANTVQTATFSNPSLMFDKKMAAHFSYLGSSFNNGMQNQFLNAGVHYSMGKYAFGGYYKRINIETQGLFVDLNGMLLGSVSINTSLTGISGAYKLNDHWRIGTNINYYVNDFIVTLEPDLSENQNYATVGLGTQYQNQKELANGNEINWSFGAVVNNFGTKQDDSYLRIQGKIGGSFGYLINMNDDKTSNLHFTFLYQADKYLVPRDNSRNTFVGMFTSLFDEPDNTIINELYMISNRFGLETLYTNKSSTKIGFRTTLEQNIGIIDKSNSWNIALILGYKEFYLNWGYHRLTDIFLYSSYNPQRSFGAEFGYQLDF